MHTSWCFFWEKTESVLEKTLGKVRGTWRVKIEYITFNTILNCTLLYSILYWTVLYNELYQWWAQTNIWINSPWILFVFVPFPQYKYIRILFLDFWTTKYILILICKLLKLKYISIFDQNIILIFAYFFLMKKVNLDMNYA